jgi:hypothetical protein
MAQAGVDHNNDSVEKAFWYFIEEQESRTEEIAWDREVLERLFCMHFGVGDGIGFEFWDLAGVPYDPLFFREDFIRRLKTLAGYPRAVFIISGLRDCIAGHRQNWTDKFKRIYAEEVTFIREMSAPWCATDTLFELLIL